MDVSYVFAGLVVASRDQAASWYARLLGRPADMLPNDAEATWQLTSATSVYLLADADRAGHGVLSLVVDDLQAQLAQITARGIVTGPVEEIPGAGRKCAITDPDGNTVSIVQLLAAQRRHRRGCPAARGQPGTAQASGAAPARARADRPG